MIRNNRSVPVSVILPNWNGKHLLAKNLSSVIKACPDAEIIVTDDASNDGSVEFVRKNYPLITVVENHVRQGFAGNINAGVSKAKGDIIILLNTDVQPEVSFLKPLLSHFTDPKVVAVGCLQKSYDKEGLVLRGRGIARWEKGYFIHTRGEVNKRDTAWVTAGNCAMRKSVWDTLGGMDTLYNPFYWEDIDLSYRMLKSGYTILFEPKSVVGHYHETGAIKTFFTASDIKRIAYRNQFIFIWKNMSDIDLWIAHIIWTPLRLMQALGRGDLLMLEGYYLAITKLPGIWKARRLASEFWCKSDKDTLSQSH